MVRDPLLHELEQGLRPSLDVGMVVVAVALTAAFALVLACPNAKGFLTRGPAVFAWPRHEPLGAADRAFLLLTLAFSFPLCALGFGSGGLAALLLAFVGGRVVNRL